MIRLLFSVCALICVLTASAIDKIILLSREEMTLTGDDILHLPGIGLGLKCGADSVMMLDNPELSSIRWIEPNDARSIVGCGGSIYAAEGDSIYRVATEAMPRQLIGRLDNEQFSLYPATDSTFYACTADEDFSCVYEVSPVERTCMPFISVEAALMKLSTVGDNTVIWIDDQILLAMSGGQLTPVFSSPTISDMQLTPVGLMVATTEGLYWITAPGKGAVIVGEPVSRVWWDNAGVLYYLVTGGDLYAVVGLREFIVTLPIPQG